MKDGESSRRLGDVGEIKLVEQLTRSLPLGDSVIKGAGDDCAVVELDDQFYSLLKTDCIVEGVHFTEDTEPELVGRKALARAISDIAAMGGIPLHALVTLVLSEDQKVSDIEGWYRGMEDLAREFSVSIVGGETSSLPSKGAVVSISLTGRVKKDHCVFRGTAAKGDLLAVTGKLGGSFKSGRHLSFQPRIAEAQWICEGGWKPTSMMDLSDGLAKDLPRLLSGAGLGYRVDRADIPVHKDADLKAALAEGEDYELLMTLPTHFVGELGEAWESKFPDTPLTIIGEVIEKTEEPLEGGWEHFSK